MQHYHSRHFMSSADRFSVALSIHQSINQPSVSNTTMLPMRVTDETGKIDNIQHMERRFVKAYKQIPLLWNPDHKDYSNKQKRNLAYDFLLPILQTHIPGASRVHVRQKINIIRSTYKKELKKYLDSKVILPDGQVCYTYKPCTWKFEAMKFLDDMKIKDDYNSNEMYKEEVVLEDGIEDYDSLNVLEAQEIECVFQEDNETDNETEEQDRIKEEISSILNQTHDDTPRTAFQPQRKYRKRKIINIEDELIDRECNAIGSNVACKLQRMTPSQRYLTELLINKLLIKGLNDKLTEDTDVTEVCYVVDNKSDNEC